MTILENRGRRPLGAAVALLLVLATALPANATPPDELTAGPSTSTKTVTSKECLRQIAAATSAKADVTTDVCTHTLTVQTSEATLVTAAELAAAKDGLSAADYSALAEMAATSAIYSKNYSQQMNNITDSETQRGKFYYNGTRVWVTVTYSGYTGTHICQIDWAVGYSVTNTGCFEGGSTSQRDLYQKWHFALIVEGSPIGWEETYTMHVNRSGSIWQ